MRKDKFELPNVDSLIQLISQKLTKDKEQNVSSFMTIDLK